MKRSKIFTAVTLHKHHHGSDAPDILGPVLSVACGIHCAATPLLLIAIPTLAPALGLAHPIFVVGVAAVALWAFIPGVRCHGRRMVFALAGVGMTLLVAGAFVAARSATLDVALTVSGAAVMLATHLYNRTLIRAAHATQAAVRIG